MWPLAGDGVRGCLPTLFNINFLNLKNIENKAGDRSRREARVSSVTLQSRTVRLQGTDSSAYPCSQQPPWLHSTHRACTQGLQGYRKVLATDPGQECLYCDRCGLYVWIWWCLPSTPCSLRSLLNANSADPGGDVRW